MTDLRVPLLDTLLPGDGGDWPAGGAHGLAPQFAEMARALPGGAEALAEVLGALPLGFTVAGAAAREVALAEIEAGRPEAFGLIVTAAYDVYYTDPAVRDVIARKTGYAARAPQPEGHDLSRFDPALLDAVRARGPLWRPVPETEGAPVPGGQEETPVPGGREEAPVPGGREEAPVPGGREEAPVPGDGAP